MSRVKGGRPDGRQCSAKSPGHTQFRLALEACKMNVKDVASWSARKKQTSRVTLASPPLALALFWIPAIAMVVTGSSNLRDGWRTVVWTAALITMGTACITNAYRCRRVHCYITGPFFILMAVVTLLYGLGVTPLGRNGWNLIGLTILFGRILRLYPHVLLRVQLPA